MDINKLRTFLIAAESGDLQATARSIFRTQPAVTQQLQKLERELGIQLFEKKGKRLILTCQGMELFERIRQPLQDVETGVDEVLNREKEAHGTIRVGIVDDHAVACNLFDRFAHFCAENPRVNIEVTLSTSKSIEPMLLENHLDLAVLVYLAQPDFFIRHYLTPATHVPVCSPKYLKRRRAIKTCADVLECDLIDQDPDWWCWADWLGEHFPKAVATLRKRSPRLTVTNYPSMKTTLLAGFGIAVLPEYLVEDELKKGSLVRLFPRKKSMQFDLTLAHRHTKVLRKCEQQLLQYVVRSR